MGGTKTPNGHIQIWQRSPEFKSKQIRNKLPIPFQRDRISYLPTEAHILANPSASISMIKTLKKLKIWSKLKRRKKNRKPNTLTQPADPSCPRCNCPVWPWPEPSAPPLPPFVNLVNSAEATPFSEITPLYASSYQRYFVPSPTYGMPIHQDAVQKDFDSRLGKCVRRIAALVTSCFSYCLR